MVKHTKTSGIPESRSNLKIDYTTRKQFQDLPTQEEINELTNQSPYVNPNYKLINKQQQQQIKNKQYYQKPSRQEYLKQYYQRPEVKLHVQEYRKQYYQRPEVKLHMQEKQKQYLIKKFKENPEWRKQYYQRPEVKERIKQYIKRKREIIPTNTELLNSLPQPYIKTRKANYYVNKEDYDKAMFIRKQLGKHFKPTIIYSGGYRARNIKRLKQQYERKKFSNIEP